MDTLITPADADSYFSGRLAPGAAYSFSGEPTTNFQAWASIPATEREAALRTASDILNRQTWRGVIADLAQPMSFPRKHLIDREGRAIPDDAIPTDIQHATAEHAFYLLTHGGDYFSDQHGRVRLRQTSAGGSSNMTMIGPSKIDTLPARIRSMIAHYLATPSAFSARMIP